MYKKVGKYFSLLVSFFRDCIIFVKSRKTEMSSAGEQLNRDKLDGWRIQFGEVIFPFLLNSEADLCLKKLIY